MTIYGKERIKRVGVQAGGKNSAMIDVATLRSLLRIDPAGPHQHACGRTVGADALVLDLTRGPAEELKARRTAAFRLLSARLPDRAHGPALLVQVHDLTSGFTDLDLDGVMPGRPDAVVLARSRSGQDVQHLGAKLAVREAEAGWLDGTTRIVAMAGADAASLMNLSSYQGCSRRLAGLAWDSAALALDLGAEPGFFSHASATPPAVAQSLTLIAARAAGVAAFDTPPSDREPSILEARCLEAYRMGFTGKIASDPADLPTINAVFGRAGLRP